MSKLYYSPTTGGFYDTSIHGGAIPTDAAEITAADHAELLAAQAAGQRIVADPDGRPVAVAPPAPDIAVVRAAALARIDAAAEAARTRWITPGAGQAMAYQAKAEEAAALQAAVAAGQAVDPAAYPHLAAEAGITAPTIEEVAAVVAGMAETWRRVSAEIEATRLAAKRAVADATLASDVADILAGLSWPAPAEA